MKAILLVTCLVLTALFSGAQDISHKQVHLSGRITELNLKDSSEKPVNGIIIDVWAEGKIILSLTSAKTGKYQGILPFFAIYQIKYSGYSFIGKMVEVDATDFREEVRLDAFVMNIDIALFKNDNYMGLDFLNDVPVAKAKFKRKLKTVQWDENYTASINKRVSSVLRAYGK